MWSCYTAIQVTAHCDTSLKYVHIHGVHDKSMDVSVTSIDLQLKTQPLSWRFSLLKVTSELVKEHHIPTCDAVIEIQNHILQPRSAALFFLSLPFPQCNQICTQTLHGSHKDMVVTTTNPCLHLAEQVAQHWKLYLARGAKNVAE